MKYKVVRKQSLSILGVKLIKTIRVISRNTGFVSKPIIVFFTKLINKGAYKEALDGIKIRPNLSSLTKNQKNDLVNDMLYTMATTGIEPGKFLELNFESKTVNERETYYAYLDLVYYVDLCLSSSSYQLFQNKETLFKMLKPFAGRQGFALTNNSQLNECASFLSNRNEVIVKPIANYGGFGVRKVRIEKNNELKLAQDLLNDGECLIEDVIIQSKDMAWLNQSSVNTIRLCSFRGENEFQIFYVALRVGRQGSVVDNWSSGGLFIGVDESTHKTLPLCYFDDKVINSAIHPDSKKDLSNFDIPDWDGLIQTAKKAASVFPQDIHVFGWDFAHTDKGWVIIELNAYPCDCQCFLGGQREKLTELFSPYISKDKLYWYK